MASELQWSEYYGENMSQILRKGNAATLMARGELTCGMSAHKLQRRDNDHR